MNFYALHIFIFVNQTDEYKKGCVATNDMMSTCKLQHSTSFFPSGQSCRSDDFNSSHFTEYKCINGKWITETYGTYSISVTETYSISVTETYGTYNISVTESWYI
jgi:hypothetical protein